MFATRADAFLRVDCRFSVYLIYYSFTSTKVQNLRVDCTPCLFISGHRRLGIHLCVCVCVCVDGEREREAYRQTDRYIRDLGSAYICVCVSIERERQTEKDRQTQTYIECVCVCVCA